MMFFTLNEKEVHAMKKLGLMLVVVIIAVVGFFTYSNTTAKDTKIAKQDYEKIGNETLKKLQGTYGDLLIPSEYYEEDMASDDEEVSDEEFVLYNVEHDMLLGKVILQDTEAAHDSLLHLELWKDFANLINPEYRQRINTFAVFSDGVANTLGYITPNSDDSGWMLGLDYADADDYGSFYSTLIHEYGHLLTLNEDEVDHNSEDGEACEFYTSDFGCSHKDSYMNQYFTQFWQASYEDWQQQNIADDEDAQVAYYEAHENEFVSDYAVTHPEEDIAESWMYFVLSPKPSEAKTVKEQKILFFYQYPELVQQRAEILQNLTKILEANAA